MSIAPLASDDPAGLGGYRLLGRLGEGGMGVVYLARSVGGRLVAVKVIRQRFADDAEYRARFRREIVAARKITGAFTAAVLRAEPDDDPPWVATAYLPGLTLRAAVVDHGPLPPESVRALGAGLAEGLADIHRAGVVHRDLKPGNVILTAPGPRLIDFGIAQVTDATAITEVGTLLGTAGYLPPERIGGAPSGPAGDVFALGAVLVFAATGRHPFGTGSAWVAAQRAQRGEADLGDLPDDALRDLVRKCLRPVPAERPSAADLVVRLGLTAGSAAIDHPGNAWLPPGVAEAVDRSAHEPVAVPVPAGAVAFVDPADPTADPSGVPAPGEVTEVPLRPARRFSRRAVVGAVGLGVVGAGAAAVAGVKIRGDAREGGSDGVDPSDTGAIVARPTPSGPVPKATATWTVSVGWALPTVTAAGRYPVAWESGRTIRVLDPADGGVRWQNDYSSGVTGAGETLYVTDVHTLDVRAHVLALDAATGATRWAFPGPDNGFTGPDPAVVAAGRVFYGDGPVRCLDAAAGGLLWTAALKYVRGLAVGSTAGGDGLVAANTLYGNVLVGLDLATGAERWRSVMEYGGPPVAGDGLVFASDRRALVYAVRGDTGAAVWRQEVPMVDDTLYHGAGRLYVNASEGRVVAFDAATGERAWVRKVGTDEGAPYDNTNKLLLDGDTLFVSATDRVLYALDRRTGDPLWTFETRTPAGRAAVVRSAAGTVDLVVYPTHDGKVHAVAPPPEASRAGA